MKLKRIFVAIIAIVLIVSGMMGNSNMAKAAGEPKVILGDGSNDYIAKAGETVTLKVPIKVTENVIYDPKVTLKDSNTDSPFSYSHPKLMMESGGDVISINPYSKAFVEFDVTAKETAKIKSYPVQLEISGIYYYFDKVTVTSTIDLDINILEEKIPAQLTVKGATLKDTVAGSDTDLAFEVKNEGEIMARNTYLSVQYGESGIVQRYSVDDMKIGDLKPGEKQIVTLPVTILPTTTTGKKSLTINFSYKNLEGAELTESRNVTIGVEENHNAPNIDIQSITYKGELKPGDDFILIASLQNVGLSTAEEVEVSVDNASIGVESFIKNYFTDELYVGTIKADNTKDAKIPLIVSKQAAGGFKELKINITYKDEFGILYSSTKTIYPEVIGGASGDKPSIVVSGVKQSPAVPKAGEKLEVSFDLENKSSVDVTELKILTELSGNTFIPQESVPYQYVEILKGGEKKRVTIPLEVSESITEGLNHLTLNIAYTGGSDKVDIPILDVQNDIGSSSKPKIIVSNYYADVEELRAGSIFNFTFDLYNTNAAVAAKNMTVTVSQAENIFSVTKGSNSFFINKIDPGETVSNTIELKVKSDASTKTYPFKITIEYEYDGLEPNPQTGEIGETKELELNLQAVENSRPVVDYVNVYSYDGMVVAGNPATLSFEFYNMGRSPLNNVIATVEGDFTKADGNMYFIGNVPEGGSSYVEFDVMPNMEGMAKGTVIITFEDSNGDEIQYIKEFETMVNGAQAWDPGMGGEFEEVFNPVMPTPKKQILPTWVFIIIEVVVFLLFIPITYKSIISIYKRKLRKKEEEQY
ncbi:hypothetical protein I5677_12415 [Mobilitalea sibirica]|uniref:Uncharacterized protein n=1 Tax=Mobilitalea sibirica TaxID=1462919 RepID=A0A8J7KXE5_9FIRM|nr:hypothetical protein [Mobilitalea sibirica]MBH1941697.1 hypothetical protein [Mobilitalea sibirica]